MRQIVLRRGEDNGDRLQLRDRHDAGLLRRIDDVALIDEAEADALPLSRRDDGRVVELHLSRRDRRGIGRDPWAMNCVDQRVLGIELLLGGEALLGEGGVALQIKLRVGEGRLVLACLAFAWSSAAWKGRASIWARRSPALTIWPSANAILLIWPSTRLRTVTVFSA